MRELKPWTVYGIKVVTYDDLLPLLREARAIAKGVVAQYGAEYCELAGAFSEYTRAKSFLDATKGVEG